MQAFKRYGGMNNSANANYVHAHKTTASSSVVTSFTGQPNTKQTSKSHVDLDGKSLLHTQTIYFQDGTSMSTAPVIENGYMVANGFLTTSDRKIKSQIQPIPDTTTVIQKLNPVSFFNHQSNQHELGLIADEVSQLCPLLVKERNDLKHINYTGIIPLLIKEIQNLQKQITVLQNASTSN